MYATKSQGKSHVSLHVTILSHMTNNKVINKYKLQLFLTLSLFNQSELKNIFSQPLPQCCRCSNIFYLFYGCLAWAIGHTAPCNFQCWCSMLAESVNAQKTTDSMNTEYGQGAPFISIFVSNIKHERALNHTKHWMWTLVWQSCSLYTLLPPARCVREKKVLLKVT